MAWLENSVEQKALSLINMRLWRNGRRAGFRFQWATVEVQVLSAAPRKFLRCLLVFGLCPKSCALTLEIFFSRPNASRQKRVPVKLFTISWEKEQTSDSGTFASSKLPKAPFVTPPHLPSEAGFASERCV